VQKSDGGREREREREKKRKRGRKESLNKRK